MTAEERARAVYRNATGPIRIDRYACDALEGEIASAIRAAVQERDDRWQAAVGMPLEQAEALAASETPRDRGEGDLSEFGEEIASGVWRIRATASAKGVLLRIRHQDNADMWMDVALSEDALRKALNACERAKEGPHTVCECGLWLSLATCSPIRPRPLPSARLA